MIRLRQLALVEMDLEPESSDESDYEDTETHEESDSFLKKSSFFYQESLRYYSNNRPINSPKQFDKQSKVNNQEAAVSEKYGPEVLHLPKQSEKHDSIESQSKSFTGDSKSVMSTCSGGGKLDAPKTTVSQTADKDSSGEGEELLLIAEEKEQDELDRMMQTLSIDESSSSVSLISNENIYLLTECEDYRGYNKEGSVICDDDDFYCGYNNEENGCSYDDRHGEIFVDSNSGHDDDHYYNTQYTYEPEEPVEVLQSNSNHVQNDDHFDDYGYEQNDVHDDSDQYRYEQEEPVEVSDHYAEEEDQYYEESDYAEEEDQCYEESNFYEEEDQFYENSGHYYDDEN